MIKKDKVLAVGWVCSYDVSYYKENSNLLVTVKRNGVCFGCMNQCKPIKVKVVEVKS